MPHKDFISKSSECISEIISKCDSLMQITDRPEIRGCMTNFNIILDRFTQYVNIADAVSIGSTGLSTINLIDEVLIDMKSASSASFRKGSGIAVKFNNSSKEIDESFNSKMAIPNCLPIFKQAIYQIVDNAVKYSIAGGSFTITLDECPQGDPSRTEFSFTNLGPRVYDSEIDEIFEESVRGESAERVKPNSGFGLGLSLVDMIVDSHKWIDAYVYAESTPPNTPFKLNDVEYYLFTIKINFKKECKKECFDIMNDGYAQLKQDIEVMFRHELAGSMSDLTRLIYNLSMQCISSKASTDDLRICAYQLFDITMDFLFFLNEQNVEGRPTELRTNTPADMLVYRSIERVYTYGLNKKFDMTWERVKQFAPLPLFHNFIVVIHMFSKNLAENSAELEMRSYEDCLELLSGNDSFLNVPIEKFIPLFAESGLTLSRDKNTILITKNVDR